MGSLFGGGGLTGFSGGGIGSSQSTNQTQNNQRYSQVANYGKYGSNDTALNGLVLGSNSHLTLTDQGAVAQSFQFANAVLTNEKALVSQSMTNANGQQAQNRSVMTMGVVLVAGVVLMAWAMNKKGK